jgi:hypothetical protein
MRPQDALAFQQAAAKLDLWVLVRGTNAASLAYIGKPGYVPKPITCKPKTADLNVPPYRTAGLVVDPELHRAAFEEHSKYNKAIYHWQKFLRQHDLPRLAPEGRRDIRLDYGVRPRGGSSRYRIDVDTQSPHYGCVTYDGKFIHGDYDLYDIIDPANPKLNEGRRETIDGETNIAHPRLDDVKRVVNGLIGVEMVLHGAAMQLEDHTKQTIELFGPRPGDRLTFHHRDEIRRWYRGLFEGRKYLKPSQATT